MSDWNPTQYLRFAEERTQPVHDLISRVRSDAPKRILDLGCGPGNSTAALRNRWPTAEVIGLDSSASMIEKARHDCSGMEFLVRDACGDLGDLGNFDLIFANASLQWMPSHDILIPRLFRMLNDRGVFAAQIPQYDHMPISRAIADLAASPRWASLLGEVRTGFSFYSDMFYYDVLSPLADEVQMWATEYFHVMDDHNDIVAMVGSTGLRPYLDRLPDDRTEEFKAHVLEALRSIYPSRGDGRVLFPFKRLFVVASR
ncbi:MAG: methyltransferase domain-containing protein [Methanomassiliicoccus sp.]|nr:methyltransferase domain-containing protein [Methanomassiliicoccus sp.]